MWKISQKENRRIYEKMLQAGLSPVLIEILRNRGYSTAKDITEYLKPSLFDLPSPFLFKDMDQVVKRLLVARTGEEKILVYGDYDADGVTGTALLYKVLKNFGFEVIVHIPSRDEGYGLHPEIIEKARDNDVRIIITVDCGITALKETQLASSLGIDVIITDHHEPLDQLPCALGILNPKVPDSGYPFVHLAGVGVVFKLAQALFSRLADTRDDHSEADYLDLAALGTIADVVPLVGENRIIVYYGLAKMEQTKHIGLKAILEECGLADKKLKAGQISFIVAPRINAAGRMDTARLALNLLLEDEYSEALQIARDLSRENRQRQLTEKEILEEAITILEKEPLPNVIVLSSLSWHHGVIGIVASRLTERYHRPVFLIAEEDGTGKGSARGIDGYDVVAELERQASLLDKYGGHKLAGGFSLPVENIPLLRERLNERVKELGGLPTQRKLLVEANVSWDNLSQDLSRELEQLAPFGAGNPAPLLYTPGLPVKKVLRIGKEGEHLKLILEDCSRSLEALFFNKGEEFDQLKNVKNIDIIYYLETNTFLGEERIQAVVKDYRNSEESSKRETAAASEPEREQLVLPENDSKDPACGVTRQELADFYQKLKKSEGENGCFCWQPPAGANEQELLYFRIFEELGLLNWAGGIGPYYLILNRVKKTDLNNSLRYRLLNIGSEI